MAVFSPFLILSFLTISVNITIGVACGRGYSRERELFLPLGSVERILLLSIIKWMCFAFLIFEKL